LINFFYAKRYDDGWYSDGADNQADIYDENGMNANKSNLDDPGLFSPTLLCISLARITMLPY